MVDAPGNWNRILYATDLLDLTKLRAAATLAASRANFPAEPSQPILSGSDLSIEQELKLFLTFGTCAIRAAISAEIVDGRCKAAFRSRVSRSDAWCLRRQGLA